MYWQTQRFQINLRRPRVMGIVNVTPDSFSDGGRHADSRDAIVQCERLLDEGADILDVGGESSRPGAESLLLEEELRRVLPVLKAAVTLGVPVSIDTYKAEVMRVALDLGVDIVNDINALRSEGAEEVVASHSSCGVCLMHMQGEPKSMQQRPGYEGDVIEAVREFLSERVSALRSRGVSDRRIVLDPGIGFGKSVEHNLELLRRQPELQVDDLPLLSGWSRKSTLGALTGRPVGHRLVPSVVAALAAIQQGARIVRVHDVAETVGAIKVWHAAGLLR